MISLQCCRYGRYEYTVLLFGLSCLYEVVLTVLDYEMKVIGRARYGEGSGAANQFAALMGHFGQVTRPCWWASPRHRKARS